PIVTISMKGRRRRFDSVEVAAVIIVTALVTYGATLRIVTNHINNLIVFGQDGLIELEPVEGTYGPAKHSRNMEEWLIRDFFQDERQGTFVDLGAYDYLRDNNTYFLEMSLGWSGLVVSPHAEFAEGYRLNRPHSKFVVWSSSDRAPLVDDRSTVVTSLP